MENQDQPSRAGGAGLVLIAALLLIAALIGLWWWMSRGRGGGGWGFGGGPTNDDGDKPEDKDKDGQHGQGDGGDGKGDGGGDGGDGGEGDGEGEGEGGDGEDDGYPMLDLPPMTDSLADCIYTIASLSETVPQIPTSYAAIRMIAEDAVCAIVQPGKGDLISYKAEWPPGKYAQWYLTAVLRLVTGKPEITQAYYNVPDDWKPYLTLIAQGILANPEWGLQGNQPALLVRGGFKDD